MALIGPFAHVEMLSVAVLVLKGNCFQRWVLGRIVRIERQVYTQAISQLELVRGCPHILCINAELVEFGFGYFDAQTVVGVIGHREMGRRFIVDEILQGSITIIAGPCTTGEGVGE